MSNDARSNVHEFPRLKSGDGGGTFDPMEARVRALEDRFGKIDPKLDAIMIDLAGMKAGLASKDDANKIDSRLSRVEG